MANQQQLDLLRQGTSLWNEWRSEQSLDFRPDLSAADLNEADLLRADLRAADLSNADLLGANLKAADLSHANLREANLAYARLSGADLTYAKLSRANLRRANLSAADLQISCLKGTDLSETNLSGAHLLGADLKAARVGQTIFANLDLRMVKGLETLDHRGPSTIGTDTISRSRGDIPEAFLRGAGLSEAFITYVRPLKQQPSEYSLCLISYSRQDQDFAEQLHADLHRTGVRCWLVPEDIETGDQVRQRIEEAILLYDKLLLVLSQHSINSSWMEFEVEEAFYQEINSCTTVLFPVLLDRSLMESTMSCVNHGCQV